MAPNNTTSAGAVMTGILTATASGFSTIRVYYSEQHLQAAAHFAGQAREAEERFRGGAPFAAIFPEHRAYVIGAVLCSVAFLEAAANEVFADAVGGAENIREPGLSGDAAWALATAWRHNIPRTARYSVPEKYQLALALARKEEFSTDAQPYQAVKDVIALRNYLTHAEPVTVVSAAAGEPSNKETQRLAGRLSGKFAESALYAGTGNAYFPDKCLGHGCAEWAVASSTRFAEEFYRRMELALTREPRSRA